MACDNSGKLIISACENETLRDGRRSTKDAVAVAVAVVAVFMVDVFVFVLMVDVFVVLVVLEVVFVVLVEVLVMMEADAIAVPTEEVSCCLLSASVSLERFIPHNTKVSAYADYVDECIMNSSFIHGRDSPAFSFCV